jgi:hypothetical protein
MYNKIDIPKKVKKTYNLERMEYLVDFAEALVIHSSTFVSNVYPR